jgi:hypothetical protein
VTAETLDAHLVGAGGDAPARAESGPTVSATTAAAADGKA